MRVFASVLCLVCLVHAVAAVDVLRTMRRTAEHEALEGMQFMELNPSKDLKNNTFVRWDVGANYAYEFSSKAAHLPHFNLPRHAKVNPHTLLEDLGLYPFAVLRGTMKLTCVCHPDKPAGGVLMRVSLHGVTSECGHDVSRTHQSCSHLAEVASALTARPFWVYVKPDGEFSRFIFDKQDVDELIGIKKSLVSELQMSSPKDPKATAAFFTNAHTVGHPPHETKVATRYRIKPFVRGDPHQVSKIDKGIIDGFLVRKEKAAHRVVRAGSAAKGTHHGLRLRNSWSYMLIGGDVDTTSAAAAKTLSARVHGTGAVAVPTHVSSIEEVNVNDALHKADALYVLSRVEMSLRAIAAGSSAAPKGACAPQ